MAQRKICRKVCAWTSVIIFFIRIKKYFIPKLGDRKFAGAYNIGIREAQLGCLSLSILLRDYGANSYQNWNTRLCWLDLGESQSDIDIDLCGIVRPPPSHFRTSNIKILLLNLWSWHFTYKFVRLLPTLLSQWFKLPSYNVIPATPLTYMPNVTPPQLQNYWTTTFAWTSYICLVRMYKCNRAYRML